MALSTQSRGCSSGSLAGADAKASRGQLTKGVKRHLGSEGALRAILCKSADPAEQTLVLGEQRGESLEIELWGSTQGPLESEDRPVHIRAH